MPLLIPLLISLAASGIQSANQQIEQGKMNEYNKQQFEAEEKQRQETADASRRNSLMKIYAQGKYGAPQQIEQFHANAAPPTIGGGWGDVIANMAGAAANTAGSLYGMQNAGKPMTAENLLGNLFTPKGLRPNASATTIPGQGGYQSDYDYSANA